MSEQNKSMVTRALEGEGVTIIDEAERRIRVSFSSETPYKRYSYDGPWLEILGHESNEIDMSRLSTGGAPVLYNHNSYSRDNHVGVIEKAFIENGRGIAEIRISKRESLSELWGDIKDKIVTGVSVGYEILEKKLTKAGDEVDEYRVTKWLPMEISFVPLAADPTVGLGRTAKTEEAIMPKVEDKKEVEATERATEVEAAEAVEAPEVEARAAGPDLEAQEVDQAALERSRILDVQAACRKFDVKPELETELIRTGASLKDAKIKILENMERAQVPINSNVRIEAGKSGKERFIEDAADAIVSRAGFGKVDSNNEMRSYSLYELARRSLELSGYTGGSTDKMGLVGRAFTQSTSDFGVLLENAMHKVLQAQYAKKKNTWTKFCKTGSVSDFRAHNRYRTGSLANLSVVNELGEFTNMTIPDGEKSSVIAQTKGGIINLSRQTIINDDLGAFIGLTSDLAQAAARTVEVDVYALLGLNSGLGPTMSDGNTLFHADHGNIGTGAAISVASIDADRVLMANQLDVGGNDYLDLEPETMLVPTGLRGAALEVNGAEYNDDSGKNQRKPNTVRGLFSDVVASSRLAGTRRYMFASHEESPVIEVSFLDGNEMPFLESQEGFTVDGTSWKVRLDFGVAAIDYRGAVTNAGA